MMVQSVSTLPAARPTTPPRFDESKTPNIFSRFFSAAVNSQANIKPVSSSGSANQVEQYKKRVAWDDTNDRSGLGASEPVAGEPKPLKSILKPYNGRQLILEPLSKLSPPHTYANLAAMLESVAQQLAGTDRNSRIDAYTSLSSVLKASENVPDVHALKEKMVLLLAFIERDMTAKTSTGALDTALVVHALALLSIFLHRPTIAESVTAAFSIYLIEHSIKTFQDSSMSKDVAKHLMLVLAEQKFSSKIMNGDRISRLLTSLHDIEKYVKGKSIVVGRINIYRTLLRNSKAHMLMNTAWMQDLFGDMFSTFKETRSSAIAFGLEAGLLLGTESKATRAFMELFSADLGDGVKFGDYYAGRLMKMTDSKQDTTSVPRIWSIPILFLRCKPRQIEQWAFLKPWLRIVEQCFNSSSQQAKFEANLAWNRLVFAIHPDEKTSPNMISLLYKPLHEQLTRKNKGRKAAIGSLCTLLYYSLKPTSPLSQLDLYWDRYVAEVIGKALTPQNTPSSNLEFARQDLIDACRILTGLFDPITPRLWSETRAMDACFGKELPMEPTELPALDSKWLRKSSTRVFPIIGPLLEKLYWDLAEDTEHVTTLWKAYITSIASPAMKEVKVSNETMSCVACLFDLLYKIWRIGPKSLQTVPPSEAASSADFLFSFERIFSTALVGLGPLPFTEKLLSSGIQDEFVVIATPSHQPRQARGNPRSPLQHLFVLLTTVCPDLGYDRNFSEMVHRILRPFLDARPSKRAKFDLILDLLNLFPPESNEPCRMIWPVLADVATFITDTRDNVNNGVGGMSDQPPGADYRQVLKILEVGVDLSPTEHLPGWKILFEAVVASATIDAGDSGRGIAVIEPLGRFLHSKFSNIDIQSKFLSQIYFRTLLSKAAYPKDRQAFDAARRRLWGTSGAKTSSFDPYTHLYEYVRESLEKGYVSFTNALGLENSDMITATTNLLSLCPAPLLSNALMKLQSGIAVWIKDESLHITGGTAVSQSISTMWSKICQLIPPLTRISNSSKLLAELEILLCSGLESRHRSIVNSSVRLWNSSFGVSKVHLAYPVRLKGILLSIHRVTELQLPFFPESLESEAPIDHHRLPNFANTQDSLGEFGSAGVDTSLAVEPVGISPRPTCRLKNHTPQVLIEVAEFLPVKRSRELTPDSHARKHRGRSIAPKLRHNDSQVQFEAIESSPINGAALDSQLLTDRQKEVRERQESEAAMFPDIRSSHRPTEKSRSSSSVGFPLHRSTSSELRVQASPAAERETTPILAPYAEDYDFVNSSPTPTRALNSDDSLLDPHSSAPEATMEQNSISVLEEMDIPSSPPEIPDEMDLDTTTPLESSAEVSLFADDNIHALSKCHIISTQQKTSSSEAAAPLESLKSASVDEVSSAGAQIVHSSLIPEQTSIEDTTAERPNTPSCGRASSPVDNQTPRSEVFHDAQTSPAVSGTHNFNGDVFEDAISSPTLHVDNMEKHQPSSPISYLDESSAMRLMAGYDQGSGLPRRSPRSAQSSTGGECPSSPTSSKDLPPETLPKSSEPSVESQSAQEFISLPSVGKTIAASSPMLSLIPETPGSKSATNLRIVDGEEIDLDDTIIVDDSILQWQMAPAVKRRKRKSDLISGKTDDDGSDKHQQEAEEFSQMNSKPKIPSPKKTSPKKRRPGRPKRDSRVTSMAHEDSQLLFSHSLSSVDSDISAQYPQEMETTANAAVSSAKEKMAEEKVDLALAMEDPPASNNEKPDMTTGQDAEQGHDEQIHIDDVPLHNNNNTFDPIMVAYTAIGQSTHSEIEDPQDIAMIATTILNTSSNPVDTRIPGHVDAFVQTDIFTEEPSIDSLKAKLKSIVSELGSVALSRDEISELEDIFMDAKQELYGAGRRGRRAKS